MSLKVKSKSYLKIRMPCHSAHGNKPKAEKFWLQEEIIKTLDNKSSLCWSDLLHFNFGLSANENLTGKT